MCRTALLLLLQAGCMSSNGDPPATTPRPSASASSSAEPQKKEEEEAPAPTAARTPVPDGPPKWKTIPKADNAAPASLRRRSA